MIAILGTGRMGGAIGRRLTELGADVMFGSRAPQCDRVSELAEQAGCPAGTIAEAIDRADIIVLATPYRALRETLDAMGPVAGKTIIDVTNALEMNDDGLMEMASPDSAGEEIARACPDAKVIKAFNTVGFHIIAEPEQAGGPVSILIAGDNGPAKSEVLALAEKMGFPSVDVGPLRQARYLEGMAALYMVPYLEGRTNDAFEYYLRPGIGPKKSEGVRAAG